MANETRKKLYTAVNNAGFDIGNYDDFDKRMNNAEDRKKFYDAVNDAGFDIGDYNDYERRIAPSKYNLTIGGKKTPVSEKQYKDFVRSHSSSQPASGTQQLQARKAQAKPQNATPTAPTQGGFTMPEGFGEADFSRGVQSPFLQEQERKAHAHDKQLAKQGLLGRTEEQKREASAKAQAKTVQKAIQGDEDAVAETGLDSATQQLRDRMDYYNATGKELKDDVLDLTSIGIAPTVARDENGEIMTNEDGTVIKGQVSDPVRAATQAMDSERMRVADLDRQIEEANDELLNLKKEIDKIETPGYVYSQDALSPYADPRTTNTDLASLSVAYTQLQEKLKGLQVERAGGQKGFFNGMLTAAKDPSTWLLGLDKLSDTAEMLRVSEKVKSGKELTDSEKKMLDATMANNAVQGKLSEDSDWLYRAGAMTTQMLPFALQIGFTGGFGSVAEMGATGGEKLAARYAAKYGEEALINRVNANIIKGLGVTFGDVAAGFCNAVTTGAANTAVDAMERRIGDLGVNEKGEYQFTGDDDWIRAIGKAIVSQTKEFATERFGEHLPSLREMNVWFAKQGMGARKIARALSGFAGTKAMQNTAAFLRKGGINGVGGEILEEEIGLPIDIAIGDMTWEDALSGKTQWDICGGMLLSMGAMHATGLAAQGVGKTYNTAQYYKYKNRADKSAHKAATMMGNDAWRAMQEKIDGTETQNMETVWEDIRNNESLSDKEKRAAFDYMNALTLMRGYNMGMFFSASEAAKNPALMAEVKPTTKKEQDEIDVMQSHDRGYNLETPQEQNDAKNMRDYARQQLEGHVSGELISRIDEDPLGTLEIIDNSDLSDEAKQKARDYVNAKATYDGMIQSVRDRIETETQQATEEIDSRVASEEQGGDGKIHPATMKADNRQVYIVSGNVRMLDDGSMVDRENSDKDLIVRDAETGKVEFVSIDDILRTDEVEDAEQLKQEAVQNIQETVATEASNAIDGVLSFEPNSNFTIMSDDGAEHTVQVVQDQGDGTVAVLIDGATDAVPMAKEQLQEMSEAYNMSRLQQYEAEKAVERAEEAQEQSETAEGAEEVAEGAEGTPAQETPTDEEEPMPMIGEGEDAEPDFASVTPERAHKYVYEESGLDEQTADEFVANNAKAAKTALDKAVAKKPKIGTNIAKYNKEKAEYEANVQAAQEQVDYWNGVKAQRDAVIAQRNAERAAERKAIEEREKAKAEAEEAARQAEITARQEEEQARGANTVGEQVKQKWNDAPKVEGSETEITLQNGERVKGRYMLVESGAATASHDAQNGFVRSEGFPVDESGQTVNDRDYERDKDAQNVTRSMGEAYDSRAIQDVPVVSRDGVVLSGNGRTMAGEIAAQNGTDGAYTEHLRNYGSQYGFTQEQVDSMQHPRLVFVPEGDMPYTTETFAKFNEQAMKSQSKTEKAVKMGKVVDDATYNNLVSMVSGFDSLSDFYNSPKGGAQAVNALQQAGVVNEKQMAELYDGEKLSEAGRALLESVLIGKAFEGNADMVRMLSEFPSLRRSVVQALTEIGRNKQLGNDYNVADELAEAVKLAYNARKQGYTQGQSVSAFARQLNLFPFDEGSETVADYTNATILMLADALNDNRETLLRNSLALYNDAANDAAAGQLDIFGGGVRSKETIIKDVLNFLNNGERKEQQAALNDVAERRKANAASGAGSTEENGTDGASDEAGEVGTFKPSDKNKELEDKAEELSSKQYELEKKRDALRADVEEQEAQKKGTRGKKRQEIEDKIKDLKKQMRDLNKQIDALDEESSDAYEAWDEVNRKELIEHFSRYSTEQLEKIAKEKEAATKDTDVLYSDDEYLAIIDLLQERAGEPQQSTDQKVTLSEHYDGEVTSETTTDRYGNTKTTFAQYRKTKSGQIKRVTKGGAEITADDIDFKAESEEFVEELTNSEKPIIVLEIRRSKDGADATIRHDGVEYDVRMKPEAAERIIKQTEQANSVGAEVANVQENEQKNEKLFDFDEIEALKDAPRYVRTAIWDYATKAYNDALAKVNPFQFGIPEEKQERMTFEKFRDEFKEVAGTFARGTDDYLPAVYEYMSKRLDIKAQEKIKQDKAIQIAEQETNTNPTEAQKEAGNYKKGHVRIDGFDVTIENPKGSVRRGTDVSGKQWEQEMQNTYGYIRGTEGVDGDHIDVFLSDDPLQGDVFVVDQVNKDGSFDEHKVMYGFPDAESARKAYLSNYEEGWQGLGAITPVSKEEFKKWINSSHRKTKPFAEYSSVKPLGDTQLGEQPTAGYSIEPTTYTNKKGKTTPMHLVTFGRELSKEEIRAGKELAKESRGWYDREKGGFMMRSEESAKELAETISKGGEAVADAQPLSLQDMASATQSEEVAVPQQQTEQPKATEKENISVEEFVQREVDAMGKHFAKDKVVKAALEKGVDDSNFYDIMYDRIQEYIYGNYSDLKDANKLAIIKDFAGVTTRSKEENTQRKNALIQKIMDKTREYASEKKEEKRKSQPANKENVTANEQPQQEEKKPKSKWVDDEDAERFEQLKAKLRQKMRGQMNMGVDPEIFALGTQMAFMIVKHGARKFADYARAMIDEMGDDIRKQLKTFYNGARDMMEDSDNEAENKIAAEMDDYDTVRKFDVANFDKPATDVFATAEQVVNEQKAEKEAETAKEKIAKERNDGRKAQENGKALDGTPLRPLTAEDLEDERPEVYHQGKRVYIMMVVHSGEQVSATQFSKPTIDGIYLTNGNRVKLEDLMVADRGEEKNQQNTSENEEKNVSLQQEQQQLDLFGNPVQETKSGKKAAVKNNVEQQKNKEDGLRRNDELRTEGLPANQTDRKGNVGELGEEARKEGNRTDGAGEAGSVGRPRQSVLDELRSSDKLEEEKLPSQKKNTGNNHAERGKDYAPKGVDARIEANIAAIELMQKLIASGKKATARDMQILRKFSGWGGLGKAFENDSPYSFNPTAKKLKELLGADGYQQAVDSRHSAYYTPANVIDALWDIARAMGFKGGKVLEGSAGIGNILGLMPRDMSERSDIQAVEIDETTGNILSLLYPDAKVEIQGFEQTKVRNGSVDLAITNVPFITDWRVMDESGDKDLSAKFHNIHDFCIAKNVRKLREGGIGIFITSNGTLDNSQALRNWLVSEGNADVVGAFRLNNETFGGTGTTSDIIVIRKRVNGKKSPNAIDVSRVTGVRTADYVDRTTMKTKTASLEYNEYFVEHPEKMGGEMAIACEKGDNYRPTSKGLYPKKGIDQKQRLTEFVEEMQSKDWESDKSQSKETNENTEVYEELGEGVKEGSMLIDKEGRLCVASYGQAVPLPDNGKKIKGHTKQECFNAYTAIKDAVAAVLDYQTKNEGNEGLQPLLDNLNKAYDDFVKTYGHLNKNTAITILKNDMEYSSIAALERFEEYNDEQGKRNVRYTKSDIFKKRVVEKESEPKPQDVKDGVITSIYMHGRIDVPYISEQLGMSEEDVKSGIIKSGLGFENPLSREMEVSYEYLSGNVREKLRQAEEANENGEYDANIKALKKVIPMDIPAHLVEFTLGSSWLDAKLYEDYIKARTDVEMTVKNIGGTWVTNDPWSYRTEKNRAMAVESRKCDKTIWGHELIAAALQNKTITVSKTETDPVTKQKTTITDKEATQMCASKIDEIRQDFKDWARDKMQNDAELAKTIGETYNERFNNYVPKTIGNEFVPEFFSGANHAIHLEPHQAKAAIRATTQPVLFAHEVGAGKTFTLITSAMEMRRLGTARKPMIVVQNATLGQFVESAKFLYPNAKVLALEESDRNKEGRKAFYAKIKYNDWDLIVIPQSAFEMIPDSEERQIAFVKAKIAEKMYVLEQLRNADVNPNDVKRAERELEKLEEELATVTMDAKTKRDEKREAKTKHNAEIKAKEMLDRKVDDVENFDDMGVDAILIDEAHEYKHLGFSTAMQRGVKGIDPSYSKKSQGVYLKCQSVKERTGGRNVVFATGTPISNTAAEIWTFMRYLMPEDVMKEYGIYYFDDFVRNFGNLSQMLEFQASGKFKENNRFAGYVNLPELVRIWSSVADTVTSREIESKREARGDESKIPEMEGGKAQDIYLPQTRALRSVMKFVKARLEEYDKMSGREKKENSHIPLTMYGLAKAAAVDPRLVLDEAEDEPNSKTNEAVRQTLKSLEDSKDYKGTVAIFSDIYQNKQSGFNLYEDIRNKLIAQGVPAEQIVIIKSGMSVNKKLEIFEKVNAGEIRVIMGSTFTLGTGVNIQERLHTLIHMDAPVRPMDYTQRNGRILRQGNLHKKWGKPVRVLRFGVEDSLDVTAYQRLKTKGAIADSIMQGKKFLENSMENRTMEEDEDVFGDTVAQLSGSEYALLKQQAEREVRKLEAKKKQHEFDQTYVYNRIPQLEGQIKASRENIADNEKALTKLQSQTSNKSLEINGKKYGSVDVMADFIKEYNKKINDESERIRKSYMDEQVKRELSVKVGGFDFNIRTILTKSNEYKNGTLTTVVKRAMTYSCDELGLKDVPVKQGLLKNALTDIVENVLPGNDFRERIEASKNFIASAEEQLEQLRQRKGKPFEQEQELTAAQARLEEYTEKMVEELAAKEAKYAEVDAEVQEANVTNTDIEDDEGSEMFRDEEDNAALEENNNEQVEEDDSVLMRDVDDEELIEQLEREPKVKVYRSMVLIDGKLYPPMSSKSDGKLRKPSELGKWEEAEEAPEKAKQGKNGKWYFSLKKDNGKNVDNVAYNPYIHTSTTMLNDQFMEAQSRDNLVVVEMEVPVSELTSGYRAEKAHDTTGVKQWKAGPIQGQLTGTREVILTRWAKPIRIVPTEEVAQSIAEQIDGQVRVMPSNVVTPQVREALEALGVQFVETNNKGKLTEGVNVGKTWVSVYGNKKTKKKGRTMQREGDGRVLSMSQDKNYSRKQRWELMQREWKRMQNKAKELIDILKLDRIAVYGTVEDMPEGMRNSLSERKKKAKGWYDTKTGKIVIILGNHRNAEDVAKTILHEAVAHYGLRKLFGKNFDTFLDNVYQNADVDVKMRIADMAARQRAKDSAANRARRTNEDYLRIGTEEYLAKLAEDMDFENRRESFWSKIKSLFIQMLESIGLKDYEAGELSDNELRYILWRSYKNLSSPGEYRNVFDVAEDVVMQENLGVGNFTRGEMPESMLLPSEKEERKRVAEQGMVGEDDRFNDADDGEIASEEELNSYDAGRMSLSESITQGLIKLARENKDNLQLRVDAMRALNGDIQKLRSAMSRQRDYDRSTVDSIVRLARMVMGTGYFNNFSNYEVRRLLSAINNATGKEDITHWANTVVDILMQHQLREAKELFERQMRVRGSKVDSRGVEVQAGLDITGQRIVSAFKDAMEIVGEETDSDGNLTAWGQRIADVYDRMGSDDEVTAQNAAAEYQGMMLAKQWYDEVRSLEQEEKNLRADLKDAEERKRNGQMTHEEYKQFVKATEDAIRENRMERIEGYGRLAVALGTEMRTSVEKAKAFREEAIERVNEIHHNANSDLEGIPADEHRKLTWQQSIANWSIVRFFMKPLATFDEMLRFFGSKSVDGKGYLWNRFMGGWTDAADREWKQLKAAHEILDKKASEVFGKKMKWSDIFSMERKMPTITVEFWDGGERKSHQLTAGNALYIYMVNKMTDGKMKLRKMGITEEDVAYIAESLDPRLIQLADWLQDDFLVNKRKDYNAVHERMFGAPMAAIDNYFPLRINDRSRGKEEEIGAPTTAEARPSTVTGSVIKRVRNTTALDIMGTDAFDVVLEHLQEMEHWAAFAELSRDLNTLCSYKRFRNRVLNMSSVRFGAGETLWKNFKDCCAIAAGVYTPMVNRNSLDTAMVNVAKGVTAAKISFRIYTALKQLLSYPAYLSEANIVELAKTTFNPVGAAQSWNWAIENLPGFAERWQSRRAGDSRLLDTDADWQFWRNKIVETASRWGMSPNAFVDGLTVSMGAKAIYETKKKRYLADGYSEEEAEKKALLDASVAYNETQQSSMNAYLSAMQVDRTAASVALTVFRNASMAYQRRMFRAMSNLKRKMRRGYKNSAIEYMAKQYQRNGLGESEAQASAIRDYNHSWYEDVANTVIFGFVMQFAWNLGPYLAYMIGGDDDDDKEEMLVDAALHALAGGIEGLSGGSVMSELYNMLRKGESVKSYNFNLLPLMSDVQNIVKKLEKDKVEAANDIINLLVQSGIGVNPQTLTDAFVAIMDYSGGDYGHARETALLILRVMNCPQSQLDKLMIDELGMTAREAQKLSVEEMADRYAEYRIRRGAPLTGWAYSDEGEYRAAERKMKIFNDKVGERVKKLSDEDLKSAFNRGDNTLRKLAGKEAAERMGGKDTYGSPSKNNLYGQVYNLIRDYNDLAEDIILNNELNKAKQKGNWDRVQDIEDAIRDITSIKKDLAETPFTLEDGTEITDKDIMKDLRELRKEYIKELVK